MNRQWFRLRLLEFSVLFLFIASFVTCDRAQDPQPLWAGAKTIVLNKETTIGSSDLDNDEFVFGVVSDIKADVRGNIYVADAGLFCIRKFTSLGTFVCTFGFGNGREPGQFMRLMKIAINAKGEVFATDSTLRRITVFDSTGNVINTIQVPMKPAQVIVNGKNDIYVVGNPISYSGPLIHKYRSDGSLLETFCKRDGIPALALKSGNFGWLASDRDGNIYYTVPFPYEIRKFSSDGELLAKFTRPVPFFAKPIVVPADKPPAKKVWMASGTMDLLILPDGKLMHLIYKRDRKRPNMQPELYFDVFSPLGDWLLSLPIQSLGLKTYGTLGMDHDWNFYVNHRRPFSRVTKYSVSIADVTKR